MSTQSKGKKKGGAAMPSDVPEDTSPEDASSTESAMLEPDSPKMPAEITQINKEGRWSFQKKQQWEKKR